MQHIILASQSPRRKALLELAEIRFEAVERNTDETFPDTMPLEEVPVYLARLKALEVDKYLDRAFHQQHSKKTILAADTLVILGDTIINKPGNRKEAVSILTELSGKRHKVITGVFILSHDKEISFSETTEVEFYPLTLEQIEFYVDKCEPYDKAGAYGIQEWIGVIGIKCINGDFYNVMGLPVSRVVQELAALQVL